MANQETTENPEFLTSHIITYIGNKRALLGNIGQEVELISRELGKEKLICADLFSGSGIVARYLKRWSENLIVNDLEDYSRILNQCYLTNKSSFPQSEYKKIREQILEAVEKAPVEGLITTHYAPRDTENVQKGERAFYTRENAILLDSYRKYIEDFAGNLSPFFLGPLLTEASIHTNTSGVFKGFYKDKNTGIGAFGGHAHNALPRIKGRLNLPEPIFSNFESNVTICQEDAVSLSKKLTSLDVAYLDPPYNQHPYGSNYFMLNLILKNHLPEDPAIKVSRVSGIPGDWNRSTFNYKKLALNSLEEIIKNLDARYIIISYNSEGFITLDQMKEMLEKYGGVKTVEIKYNAFKGSRNLSARDIHVKEYLFVLRK